jgi:Rrf2 family protein
MKFSSQEEYGLRCLLQIARKGTDGSLTIPEVSRLEGLPQTNVAKMLMILRKEGFIVSTRGQSGGYAISRPAEQIVVGEVLAALGGRLYDDEFCRRHRGNLDVCTHSVDCSVKSLWQVLQGAVNRVVDQLTLADMLLPDVAATNVVFLAQPSRPPACLRN